MFIHYTFKQLRDGWQNANWPKISRAIVWFTFGKRCDFHALSSSGKVELSMQSFKICVKGSTHISEMDSRIFGEMLLCVVAFLGFTFLPYLSMVSGATF